MHNRYIIAFVIFLVCGFSFYPPIQIRAGTAPTVNSVTAAGTSQGNSSTLTLAENTTTTLYAHGTITDVDGCADVATSGSVTGKFYRTNHVSSDGCSADNNDCYVISNTNCTKTACDGPEDTTFSYECTSAIQYYADSTIGGSHSATDWTVKITAVDGGSLSGNATDTIEMNSTIALTTTSSINYGSLSLDGESTQKTTTITNTGNTGIDIDVSAGSNMTCDSGSITASAAKYSITSGFLYSDGTTVTTSPSELEFNFSPRTNDAAAQTKDVYFILKAPATGAGGNCANTLTITSRADTENGW